MSVFCYSDVRGGIVLSQGFNREQALALRKLCIRDSAKLTWKSWLTLCSTRLSPSCQRQHNALTAVKQDQFQSRQVILSPKKWRENQKSCLQSLVLLWAVLVAFTRVVDLSSNVIFAFNRSAATSMVHHVMSTPRLGVLQTVKTSFRNLTTSSILLLCSAKTQKENCYWARDSFTPSCNDTKIQYQLVSHDEMSDDTTQSCQSNEIR